MKPRMSGDSKKVQNVSSNLLSQEENQKVFYALGKQCSVCVSSVTYILLNNFCSNNIMVINNVL